MNANINSNINSSRVSSIVKVTPVAAPFYSLCLAAASAPLLSSVSVTGISEAKAHRVSFNVYGLSKAGFFMERTQAGIGDFYLSPDSDSLVFDFSELSCRIRDEFFRTLKSPVTGKLCVEAVIDGVKYMGDAPVMLLPAKVYPSSASPVVFASFLSPCHPEIERIAFGCEKTLPALYSALRAERMIYSVRDCDFASHDIAFEDIGTVFSKRSKMASPLEMAMVFCSCALKAGLYPIVAASKNRKAPRIFCGVCEKSGLFGVISSSTSEIYDLALTGKISLFDISCLFTGHNIEPADAVSSACDELGSQEILFALDITAALRNGVGFCSLDINTAESEKAFLDSLRKSAPSHKRTLSDYAEFLSDTSDSSLLGFSFARCPGIPIGFYDFSKISSAASSVRGFSVISLSDKIDVRRFAPLGAGVCSMLVSEEYRRIELTLAEKQEIGCDIDNYKAALFESQERFCLGSPLRQHEISEISEKLEVYDCGKNEIYLACGFLRRGGKYAPLALYPVKLESGKNSVLPQLTFLSPKPYPNRLLCEKLKESSVGRSFFADYGLPGGSLDNIISCFEAFCRSAKSDFEVVKECAVASFPYKNSVLSFSIVDRVDKILADKLSRALLSSEAVYSDTSSDVSRSRISELESVSPAQYESCVYENTARALDGDMLVSDVSFGTMLDTAVAVSTENLRLGHTTLLVSDSVVVRGELQNRMADIGISDAVLTLAGGFDIKDSIRRKLISLSKTEMPDERGGDTSEYSHIREQLDKYNECKTRTYDFDFSFADASSAFIRAGELLSDEEKHIILEPENLFFPDMGKESTAAVFSALLRLCRAAAPLCSKFPYSQHPMFGVGITDTGANVRSCSYLADKCLTELEEFVPACKSIAEKAGFCINDIKTLPALHAFLSLMVLISKEYDSGITEKLLVSDVYSVSKKTAELRELSGKIADAERELCEFDRGVYSLDSKALFDEWASPDEMSHSEITKIVNAYRTVNVPSDLPKKSIPDALRLLYNRSQLVEEFALGELEMKELFAGYWNGANTDWNKICGLTDFTKMADVLLKKIYGMDSEQRKNAAKSFPQAASFCSDRLNITGVLSAAGLFDRMFSDEGSFVALTKILCADLYNMSFPDGIFSDNGLRTVICGWRDHADDIPAVGEFNLRAAECAKLGLSCFVRYFDSNCCSSHTEKIFTRSLLFLALKQMTFYDKNFLALGGCTEDVTRFAMHHTEKTELNRRILKAGYLRSCAAYINRNSEKASAFSESLCDNSFSPEEILLRYGESVKALFPIIIAEPSYAGILSDFENVVVLEADIMPSARALPFLYTARHKLILSSACSESSDCLANDCVKTGIAGSVHNRDRLSQGAIGFLGAYTEISCLRTPVSSFDKERSTNVLEAQTIGLELLKLFESRPDTSADVLTLTLNQRAVIEEILSAVAEKSANVALAMRDGRITYDFAGTRGGRSCDVLYVSTVYGKDEASGMCMSCGELEDRSKTVGGISELISRALSGAASKIVVVTSLVGGVYPGRSGSFGVKQLFSLVEFAQSGGCMKSFGDESLRTPYISLFSSLMSENKIAVRVLRSGRTSVITIGDDEYAVMFEEPFSRAAYDREYRECRILTDAGYKVLRFDGADLVLNPRKILDRIDSLREERQ